MIARFQPFAVDRHKFGETYNYHCSLVPDGNMWIQITDYDAMMLLPEQYALIEKAIKRYPDTAIFGAMCNRVGYSFQRLTIEPDTNDSIRHHIREAEGQMWRYPDGECEEVKSIAGFFMLFRKSYWEACGGFQDTIIKNDGIHANLFDYEFSKFARINKMPIRVIKGLYLWHTYRLNSENYKSKDHLKC